MVNFNNDTTITRPRQDIVNTAILERRQAVIDQLTEYKVRDIKKGSDSFRLAVFSAHLYTLLHEIEPMLDKEWIKIKENPYKEIKDIYTYIDNNQEEEVIKAWRFINKFLYSKGITKSDTRENLDRSDILLMNDEANM